MPCYFSFNMCIVVNGNIKPYCLSPPAAKSEVQSTLASHVNQTWSSMSTSISQADETSPSRWKSPSAQGRQSRSKPKPIWLITWLKLPVPRLQLAVPPILAINKTREWIPASYRTCRCFRLTLFSFSCCVLPCYLEWSWTKNGNHRGIKIDVSWR
jgi:hypothetical protein